MQTLLYLVVVGVACYGAFFAANQLGLSDHSAQAMVLDKKHNESGKSYVTQVINGKSVVQAHETPETFVLVVEIDGEKALAFVDSDRFSEIEISQRLTVRYQRTRITGTIRVVAVDV